MEAPPNHRLADPFGTGQTDLVIKLTAFPLDETKTFLIPFLFDHLLALYSSAIIPLAYIPPAPSCLPKHSRSTLAFNLNFLLIIIEQVVVLPRYCP